MGQKWTRVLLFSGKPLDTNMVLCCTEKLCGGTDTAPQGAHPLYRLSTASKQKIYQSEKRKVIGQTTRPTLSRCGSRKNYIPSLADLIDSSRCSEEGCLWNPSALSVWTI